MRFINGLFMGIFGTLAAGLMSYVWFNAEIKTK